MRKIYRTNKGHAMYVSPFLPEKYRELGSIPYEVQFFEYDGETDTLTLKIKLHAKHVKVVEPRRPRGTIKKKKKEVSKDG